MEGQDYESKAKQIFIKNKDILDDKKYYEFGQKIKLISHRKIQSKRYEQAQQILIYSCVNLFANKQVQQNICFQLVQQLIELYKTNPQLFIEQRQRKLIQIFKYRGLTVKQISLLTELVRKIGKPAKSRILSEEIIKFRVSRKQFATVEKIAAGLSQQIALNFVRQWTQHSQITQQQKPALWMRMALCRGVTFDLNESRQVLKQTPQKYWDSAFVQFTKMLIQTCSIKSQQAYSLLQKSYADFLENDYIFKGLYNSFGTKYFNKKVQTSGLMGLLSS